MKRLIAFAFLFFALTSCTVSVESVIKTPQRFQNRDIRLKGYILDKRAVPLTSLALYTLYDGSGKLLVLDLRGEEPFRPNQHVSIKGSFFYLGLKGHEKEQTDFKRFLKNKLHSAGSHKRFSEKLFNVSYRFLTRLLEKRANLMIVVLSE